MGFRETKVAPLEFDVVTSMAHDDIQVLADLAAEQSARVLNSSVKPGKVTPSLLEYVVEGPGGLVTQMVFGLHLASDDAGKSRVRLEVGDFRTTRPAIFGLIPVGPKSAPALESLKKFVTFLQPRLEARP